MNAWKLVIRFFIAVLGILAVGLIIIGTVFLVAQHRHKKNNDFPEDSEYKRFLQKETTFRFCYGVCVAADTFLQGVAVVANALNVFIILIINNSDNTIIAFLLITSFIADSLRNTLNLKNCRMAYAKAFRILEFALDEYRISERKSEDKERLIEENKKAQSVISDFVE